MKNLIKSLSLLMAVLLLLTMVILPVMAEETTTEETTTEEVTTVEEETTTEEVTTEGETTTAEETTTATPSSGEKEEGPKNFGEWVSANRNAFVWIIFAVILVIVLVVLFVRFPGKVKSLYTSLKAECKRITWFSKEQTKKASLVVILVLLAFAIVICLLDLGISKAILALVEALAK